jgi:hypothetical protein
MAGIDHAKVSAKADGGDATLILPSDWNADHTIASATITLAHMASLAQNRIIGRVTGSTGVPEALTAANVKTILALAASEITADSTTLVGTGTTVQAVFEELDNGIADHLADTSAAHAASAISFAPAGTIAATDVQAAIVEVASEASTAFVSISKWGGF